MSSWGCLGRRVAPDSRMARVGYELHIFYKTRRGKNIVHEDDS